MARSGVELMGLEYEAERLVRSGTSRAEVARILGVHPQTLAGWALRGGWRKKDLDLERSVAITRRVVRNVAAAHAWEAEKRCVMAEQARVMREAISLIAAGDGAGASRLLAGVQDRVLPALPGLDTRDEYAVEAETLKVSLGDAAKKYDEGYVPPPILTEAGEVDWGDEEDGALCD